MSNTFELPGQHHYRMDFISKYRTINNIGNIEALSHCYANYKVLGVFYPPEIMKKIYDFDEQFGVKSEKSFAKYEKAKTDVQTTKSIYKPKNFSSAQDVAGFRFITFVKSAIDTDETVVNTPTNETNIVQNKSEIQPIIPLPIENPEYIKFNDALADSPLKETLQEFQTMYIKMKITDSSLFSTEEILKGISEKCKLSLQLKFNYDLKIRSGTIKIILNDTILIGEGCGINKKIATEEAMLNFHMQCVKDVNISQKNVENTQCYPPEDSSDSDLEVIPEGAEFNELDILRDFYIKNNRTNIATSILLEAFQFFRMTMAFKEIDGTVHLFVNNSSLASMPLDVSLSNTKVRLSNFVLQNLENSKFTMMKNTCYINEFDDSVDKAGMYDKNLKDYTKIDSSMNIGGKLMLKMGWSEDSGLGKTGTGMKEPIINDSTGKRQGLGFNFGSSQDLKSFGNNVSQCLRDWLKEDGDDIIFDRNFDNKERALIHKECRKLGVMSKSHNNTNGDRFLVVSKYRSPQELIEWVQSKGGKTRLYTLLPPGYRKLQCDLF